MTAPHCGGGRRFGWVVVAVLVATAAGSWAGQARNLVLMIVDGAGFNAFDCVSYYEHGRRGGSLYDAFAVTLGCNTSPAGVDPYDPAKAWSDFKGLRDKATDSAASGTALNTGVKTKNGRLGVDVEGRPVTTISEIAHAAGKATGTVTSVPFCHATPAATVAHVPSRGEYHTIAEQMLYQSNLTVLFGGGHPEYDNNGRHRGVKDGADEFIPFSVLQALRDGTTGRGWTFIEHFQQFQELASGSPTSENRVFGLVPCESTLQYGRAGKGLGNLNPNMPDLAMLTTAALNVLGQDPDGFYLMVEGGAVDWANHGRNLERMLEEFVDFNRAIQAVFDWLAAHDQLDETLIIVTSDHECGQIWGPNAGPDSETPFDLPRNRGKGKLPDARHYSGGHTNVLVPLYATGPGSERFEALVDGTDPQAAKAWGFCGRYVDNTDVFTVMKQAITAGK